eukprot:2771624-Ditylum_brightwellii.AAC.1
MVSQQLHWIGKIACMDEKQLPRKCLAAWHIHPRPVGRPQTTICHIYLHALWFAGVTEDSDKAGKLSDWMPKIQEDPKKWDAFRRSITPNLIGKKIV